MKKTILVLGLAASLFSCQKDEVVNNEINRGNHQTELSLSAEDIRLNQHGILSFKNEELFLATVHQLKQKTDERNIEFMSKLDKDISPEALSDKMTEAGYNPFQILDDFEHSRKYKSLRTTISQEIERLLKENRLEDENNPNGHQVSNESWRTVLNQFGEVKIGAMTHIYKANGDYYALYKDNDETIGLIRKNEFRYNEEIHGKLMKYIPANTMSTCQASHSYTKTKTLPPVPLSGVKKVVGTMSLWALLSPIVDFNGNVIGSYVSKGYTGLNVKAYINSTRVYPTFSLSNFSSKWSPNCNGNYMTKSVSSVPLPTSLIQDQTLVFPLGNARHLMNSNHSQALAVCWGTFFTINI